MPAQASEAKPGMPLVLRLIGSPEAIALARRIIAEQADPANVEGRTTVAFPAGPGPTVGKVILIPNDPVDVGRVVGRKMRTLVHLRKMTGVYVRLEKDVPPSVPTRKLTLIGTRAQVAKASDVVHYLRFMNRPDAARSADDGDSGGATPSTTSNTAGGGGNGAAAAGAGAGGESGVEGRRADEIDLDPNDVDITEQTAASKDDRTT
jgi:hypothetical protein